MTAQGASKYLTLAQAAKLAPGRPSSCAVWRWARRGVKSRSGRRVRLKHIRVGRRLFTTLVDLEHFFADVAAADCQGTGDRDPVSCRRTIPPMPRSHEQVEAELTRMGI